MAVEGEERGHASDPPEQLFRKRRRRTRSRRFGDVDVAPSVTGEDDESEEDEKKDALLIREAQRMRQRNRRLNVASTTFGATRTPSSHAPVESEDTVVEGLRHNFKIETSNQEVERQMEQYIEERLETKPEGHAQKRSRPTDEEELFRIPKHLQVNARPVYDPGEGLPLAGLEEVALGAEVRHQNIIETERARRTLMSDKARLAEELRQARHDAEAKDAEAKVVVPGNISADYHQHRQDFIQEIRASNNKSSKNEPNAARRGLATDHVVANRFKTRFNKG